MSKSRDSRHGYRPVGDGTPRRPSAMAVELDFNLSAPTSGTISYGGGGGALIGSNIEVDNVVGLLHAGQCQCHLGLFQLPVELHLGNA